MPSLTPKKIDGHTYYYARYCQRVDGKPKIVRTVYLGRIEDLVATTEAGHQPPQPQQTVVAAFGDVAALWHIAGQPYRGLGRHHRGRPPAPTAPADRGGRLRRCGCPLAYRRAPAGAPPAR